jgi:NAD(P)-dependent dehydrogenase (short-subunit alcohol dehydrogenase family)
MEFQPMRLQNKRAVVTGAGGGIGSTTASFFAREGARVVIAELSEESGSAAAQAIQADGGEATFVQADVTDLDSVADLVERADEILGGIDIWMNNAGDSKTEDLLETDPAAWLDDLDLNLTAHFLCSRAVVPIMRRTGGGSIINISSVNGLWSIGEVGYSAAKAGLISLTKNIAVRYGRDGIRANVICPGTILTPRGAAYWDAKAGSVEKLLRWYPVGRLGKPEDVANLAVYLASDESAFATGAVFVLDGGLTAGTTLFGT